MAKNVLLPADMTYAEWQDWQLAGAPADVQGWRGSVLANGAKAGYTVTADGISTSTTKHMLMRLKERGVDFSSVEDALTNPLHITETRIDNKQRPSRKYIGETATVTINPENGKLTSTWRTGKDKLKKYRKG